jgi:hypothetical protein
MDYGFRLSVDSKSKGAVVAYIESDTAGMDNSGLQGEGRTRIIIVWEGQVYGKSVECMNGRWITHQTVHLRDRAAHSTRSEVY